MAFTVSSKATRKDLEKMLVGLEKTVIAGHKEAGNFILAKVADDFPINSKRAFNDVKRSMERLKDGTIITRVGSEEIGYTKFIEEGRPAGTLPNFNSISKWLARKKDLQKDIFKKLFPKPKKLRKKKPKFGYAFKPILVRHDYDDLNYKQKGLVWTIAKGIEAKGYKGKFIFKKVRDNYGDKAGQMVVDRVTKYMNSFK